MQSGKLDLVSSERDYYTSKQAPDIVTFSEKRYIALDGRGTPGSELFRSHIESLFSIAYQLKNAEKSLGRDFVVPKLEALWFADEGKNFDKEPPTEWNWTILIRIPDYVSESSLNEAKLEAMEKKKLRDVSRIAIRSLNEGKCVQALHVGPYDTVGRTYFRIRSFMSKNGLIPNGNYHEIYLSDPARSRAENLKTIVRQPVK